MSRAIDIPKRAVLESWKLVRANKGSYGIDRKSIEDFEENLKDELYKVWNRMCSGSYFPPSVLGIDIPKRNGKFRRLGIPTVADRVAQGVIKVLFEHRLEKFFSMTLMGIDQGDPAMML